MSRSYQLICILLAFCSLNLQAQDHLAKLKQRADELPENQSKVEALIELGRHLQNSRPRQSIKRLEEAIDLAKSIDFEEGVTNAGYNLAVTYYTSGRINKSIETLEGRLDYLTANRTSDHLQSYYLLLAQIHGKKKDLVELRRYQQLYIALQDSLTQAQANAEIKIFEQKFEEEKAVASKAVQLRDQAITDLQKQEEINLRKQLEIAQLQKQTAELERANAEQQQRRLMDENRAIQLEVELNQKIANRNRLIVIAFGILLLVGVLAQRIRILQQRKKVAFEKEKSKRLEQIDELKDQFLANTSHELRTPLNGIIGIAEGLRDGVHADDPIQQKSNLAMIVSSGKRLSNLVNDLLDFSKMRNDELHLNLKPVDIWSLTEIVIQMNKSMADAKEVTISNELSKNAKAVSADEDRLQQILFNLIDNAIKFSDGGSVTITGEIQNNHMAISVKDEGVGISKHQMEEIFDEFKQLDAATDRKYRGTGLGLSITSKLVKLHGGQICVSSSPGQGSTFTFTLPLTSDAAASGTVVEQLSRTVSTALDETIVPAIIPKASKQESSKIRILIVDDEPINHQVLHNHLGTQHYDITSAMDGNKAIKLLDDGFQFDLVLLDIMMPRMTGYAVCQQIRKKFLASELPVIMITAKNQVSDLVEALSYGANDYLAKPFSKDEFLARIKTHLDLYTINSAMTRFVPSEFLRSLGYNSITDVKLGDYQERAVTVFFSDIRSYTTMSESMTPEETFRFVAAYVNRMGPIIKRFNGFVLQYLGDGIMALFLESPDHAIRAAVAMQQQIMAYNDERAAKGRDQIKVGMGLHTGPLVMGIIGDRTRNDPATISDAVNIASRMEGLTRQFGASILITKETMAQLTNPEEFKHRYLGEVVTKGKTELVEIFEILNGEKTARADSKSATKEIFERAVAHFKDEEYTLATELFEEVLSKDPTDKAASYYLMKSTSLFSLKNIEGTDHFG